MRYRSPPTVRNFPLTRVSITTWSLVLIGCAREGRGQCSAVRRLQSAEHPAISTLWPQLSPAAHHWSRLESPWFCRQAGLPAPSADRVHDEAGCSGRPGCPVAPTNPVDCTEIPHVPAKKRLVRAT